MNPETKEAYKLFHDGILALEEAEWHGLRIDTKYMEKVEKEITDKVIGYEETFYGTDFFKEWEKSTTKKVNIYSSDQLGKYLYDVKGIKPKKQTKKGKGSTDEEALRLLEIPELEAILQIKKLKKIRDTYLAQFKREVVENKIHPFFQLHLVRTYRGSASSPNFQNIPKRDKEAMQTVRRAIYPSKGNQLLEMDYGQLEVRIGACVSKDKKLIEDILHGDMHRDVAQELFLVDKIDKSQTGHAKLRGAAKNGFVFPQFYGDYYVSCAENLAQNWGNLPQGRWKKEMGIEIEEGLTLGEHLINNGIKRYDTFVNHVKDVEYNFWKKRYRKHNNWREKIWKEYQKNGFVTSKTGFTFQGIMKRNDVINYPVQSAAFHCLLWSLIEGTKAFKREKMKTRIVGQIHDAIVFDLYPPELKKVIRIMKCIMENDVRQKWPWIIVPLEVDAELCPVNGSWAEKEDYDITKI